MRTRSSQEKDNVWRLEISAQDRLTLTSSSDTKAFYQVTNSNGQRVADGTSRSMDSTIEFDILEWPSGVYTIEIAEENSQQVLHFVKT